MAYDYSGNGKDGTQSGGLTLGVAGPRPPAFAGFSSSTVAYQFDGASASVDCGTGPALSGTTDFTLEAWINTTSTTFARLMQQRSGYNGEYMFDDAGRAEVRIVRRRSERELVGGRLSQDDRRLPRADAIPAPHPSAGTCSAKSADPYVVRIPARPR